jgi:hypothetical protein
MAPGKWGTSCSSSAGAQDHRTSQLHKFTRANSHATDDEESESSSAESSPVTKPIARRSKFEDEEEDSDVRQPTIPRAAQLCPAMHKRCTF